MKVIIQRALGGRLNAYKEVLDRYKATYHISDEVIINHYAIIEIEDLNQLFNLAKQLRWDLVIDPHRERIYIFDESFD